MEDEEIISEEAVPELPVEPADVDITSYRLPPFPHPLHHPIQALVWTVRAAFGITSLILLLAVVAAIPVVNFLALGYLLEVEARVARTGKLRNAFLLLDVAPRIGSIVLCTWLWLAPLRFISVLWNDAHWIQPDGPADRTWSVVAPLAAMFVGIHLCLALARGGSFWCFFRPIKNLRWMLQHWSAGDYLDIANSGIRDFISRLRLKHHFLLGVKGWAGTLLILLIPTALLAAGDPDNPATYLLSLIAAPFMMLALSWAPFLQAHFAVTGEWRAFSQVGTIRQYFKRAPIAWLCAIVLTYVLSFPLFLAKVYLLPQDARWFVTTIFIVSIYPAKVVTGWALHRAATRSTKPWFGWRWITRALLLPLLALYVFLLFFTPTISEHGKLVLFEHHALLLPVP